MEDETQASAQGAKIGLEKFLNTIVLVSVKDGRKFRGKLTQFDEYMNMLMEDVEEISKTGTKSSHKLILLKGGNISDVSV